MRAALDALGRARWPLLLLGLCLLGAAAALADETQRAAVQAVLLSLGAVLVGAGIVLVAWGHPDPLHGPDDPDPPGPTP